MEEDNMANPEHLAILKKGAEARNEWREQNPDIVPDLRKANLIEYALVGIHFTRTDLRNVNLAGAQLSNSNLMYANLRGRRMTK